MKYLCSYKNKGLIQLCVTPGVGAYPLLSGKEGHLPPKFWSSFFYTNHLYSGRYGNLLYKESLFVFIP